MSVSVLATAPTSSRADLPVPRTARSIVDHLLCVADTVFTDDQTDPPALAPSPEWVEFHTVLAELVELDADALMAGKMPAAQEWLAEIQQSRYTLKLRARALRSHLIATGQTPDMADLP